jgi:tetratricopeptide (TPR) repeat protein
MGKKKNCAKRMLKKMPQRQISPSISLCMMVKNEEEMLPRCLESAKAWVDEIIIVDTGSTDRTVEIARRYTEKIYFHSWFDDFSGMRNITLSYATGDWILVLDADEEVQNGSLIRGAVKDNQVNAMAVIVMNMGSKGEIHSRFNSIRLWRNGLGFSYRDIVHNQLQFYGPTCMVPITVLHYGYNQGSQKSEEKFTRTVNLLKRQLKEGSSNPAFTILNMIKIYVSFERYIDAINVGEELLASVDGLSALDQNLRGELLLAVALAHYKIGNYTRAKELYRRVLNAASYCVDALLGLGLVAMEAGNLEEAEKSFREYLRMWDKAVQELGSSLNVHHNSFPDQVYYNLGLVYMRRKEVRRAILHFEKAIQMNPRHGPAHVQLSEVYLLLGDSAKAKYHAQQVLNLNLKEAGLNAMGAVYIEEGKLQEAESCFRECLNEFPGSSYARHNLGALFWKKGRRLDAKRLFQEAVDADPHNFVFQSSLSKAEAYIKENPTISLCMMIKNEAKFLAGCLESVEGVVDEIVVVDTGSTDESMGIAKKFGVRFYEHPWFDDFSGMRNFTISHAMGDWILVLDGDEALEVKDKPVLRRFVRHALEQSAKGVTFIIYNYANRGRDETTGTSIRLFRNDGEIHYEGIVHNDLIIQGKILPSLIHVHHYGYDQGPAMAQAKFERTANLLRKMIAKDPEDIRAHYHLMKSYASIGLFVEAIREGEKTLDLVRRKGEKVGNTYLFDIYPLLGGYHRFVGELVKAERICQEGLQLDDRHPDLYYGLAAIENQRNSYAKSKEYCMLALSHLEDCQQGRAYFATTINSTRHRILANLAEICFRMKDFDEALKYCREALSEKPEFAEAYGLKAQILISRGLFESAERSLLKLKAIDPEFSHLWYNLGRCYLGQEKYEQAFNAFLLAREKLPDMVSIHHYLGKIALKKRKFKDAEESLLKAATLAPHDLDLLNELALVLEYNGNIGAAIEAFEAMDRLDPSIAGLKSKIAELYSRKGEMENAGVFIEQGANNFS